MKRMDFTDSEMTVIRLALETQERVMIDRGAHEATEAAHQLRAKIKDETGR